MEKACLLPVAVAGALMPDAHVGYGLPIGGVLATDNAVIPYAVGVDIACRMKMTVLDLPLRDLERHRDRLTRAIEAETRFGVGASFSQRRAHAVLDADWSVSPVTQQNKDRAWSQLGTSGSGNHFVEFGLFTANQQQPAGACNRRRRIFPCRSRISLPQGSAHLHRRNFRRYQAGATGQKTDGRS